MIDAEHLRERLSYDPITGEWIWISSPRRGYEGKPAGSFDVYGYLCIKIDGQSYKASRLAYLYMTGEWPEEEMDHIDRDPGNDKWVNLKPASRFENTSNRRMRSDNTSGVIGVFWNAQRSKWQVQVDKVHIGLFDDLQEATIARDAAAMQMHRSFAVLNDPFCQANLYDIRGSVAMEIQL